MSEIPIEFIIILIGFLFIFIGLALVYLRILKVYGGILIIIMGVYIFYPGITNFISTSFNAVVLGTICIGLGFYFMLESYFTEDEPSTEELEEGENED